jgi:hypothetical protein
MSNESSFVGLNISEEVANFGSLNEILADADSPFKDLRTLTKNLRVEGSDIVYFEEAVRGSLEGRSIAVKSSGKSTKKKPSLDELKVFYAESPIHRNTMRVELKVLKTLEVPSPQDASGLIINNTELEHSVEQRLGVLAEEQMLENFPLNDAFKRSKLIIDDKYERMSVPGCKGSYCEYVFNAMSLLAKKSFSKCHTQIPLHRAVLFRIPRKWLDQDKVEMLLATTFPQQRLNIQKEVSKGDLNCDNSRLNDATVLPRINQSTGCVGSPMKQKKDEGPASYLNCRSSAASYDALNVCENCFKIYGALHNIKKHQESQKKQLRIAAVDRQSSSNTASLNPKSLSPPMANSSGSALMTPEQKKVEASTSMVAASGSSDVGMRFVGSPDIAKSSSPTPSSPNQNAAKSTSPLNRSKTRRKGLLGASIQSDSSETGEYLTIDMDWRIKNFSQKQAAGMLGGGPHVSQGRMQVLGVHHELEIETLTADELLLQESSAPAPVPIPVQDTVELTKLLRHNLSDRIWDDVDFQREMREEKYYFDLCRNGDGKVAVLVVVENDLKLLTPKTLLGMLAVNNKMPGFVKFSLLKSTFQEQRRLKKAVNEAKIRLRGVSHSQQRRNAVS